MSQPKIKVTNLNKSFSGKKVLKNINVNIEEGKSHVIIGGSGSGKSVLIKSIVGLIEPDHGSSVQVDGQEMLPFSENKVNLLMDKCGFLFQSGALFDSLPVWRNISFRLIQRDNMPIAEARNLAEKKLEQVGLNAGILDLFPAELSGGMQKRVALARSIAHDPEIIFFDEPTTGLDPIMSAVINNLINKTKKELKATTITITHDMKTVATIADNVSMLVEGEIIWGGSHEEMASSENKILKQFINGTI